MEWTKVESKEQVQSDAWSPKEGDELIGKLKGVEIVGSKDSNLYSFKTKKGLVKVWGCLVLDDRLAEVEQDTEVKLVYGGKQKSATGNMYHSYEVWINQ